jgi:hypothetical protein
MRRYEYSSRRGAAMVEAVLIMPLFLMFWFGIVDWGITFWTHQSLVFAANEAARWGVVHGYDPVAMSNLVVYGTTSPSTGQGMRFGINPSNVTVSLVCASGVTCGTDASDLSSSRRIVIQIKNYQRSHFTPFLAGSYTGRTITVSLPTENLSDTIATGT